MAVRAFKSQPAPYTNVNVKEQDIGEIDVSGVSIKLIILEYENLVWGQSLKSFKFRAHQSDSVKFYGQPLKFKYSQQWNLNAIDTYFMLKIKIMKW